MSAWSGPSATTRGAAPLAAPIIRPYEPRDAAQLGGLAAEMAVALAEPPPLLDADLLQRVTDPGTPWADILVAAEGEALLGFAVFSRRFEAHRGRLSLWLADLHVAAAARRRGVGRRLMAAVGARAEALGCGEVAWDLWVLNEPARAFYRELGATVDSEVEVLRIAPDRLRLP